MVQAGERGRKWGATGRESRRSVTSLDNKVQCFTGHVSGVARLDVDARLLSAAESPHVDACAAASPSGSTSGFDRDDLPASADTRGQKCGCYTLSMDTRYQLESLADHDLVNRLSALVRAERNVLADVLAHIAEVDARKIYLMYGCSSMYVYCTEILGLCESGAYTRIRAARLARARPEVFGDVAAGRLGLSGINVLAPHVGGAGAHAGTDTDDANDANDADANDADANANDADTRDHGNALLEAARNKSTRVIRELVAGTHPAPDVADTIRPIAQDRVVVRFGASKGFDEKLQQARALLSHSVPDGRFEHVLERALDLVLEHAHKTRFARTDAPRQARPSGERNRHIPAPVKRTIIARDGARCSFVGVNGRRCDDSAFIQFHHDDVYARGGEHSAQTMRMLCAGHNRYLAEQDFGLEQLARYNSRDRSGDPSPKRAALCDESQTRTSRPCDEAPTRTSRPSGQLASTRVPRTPGAASADTSRATGVRPGAASNDSAEPRSLQPAQPKQPEQPVQLDSISALVNLGFKAAAARRAVAVALAALPPDASVQGVVRLALRHVC